MTGPEDDGTSFSFLRLVFFSLGAGVLVLIISIPIIVGVAQWSATAGLVAALLAVVAIIAAIGTVSRRMVGAAEREIRARQALDSQAGPDSQAGIENRAGQDSAGDGAPPPAEH